MRICKLFALQLRSVVLNRYWLAITLLVQLLIFSACASTDTPREIHTQASSDTPQPSITPTPTITLQPTITFTPEPTLTPTIMPTIEPMIAIANTSVTFRSEPRRGSDNIGGVYGNQSVRVIARNDAANWLYIIAPDAPDGMAWVLAGAFSLQGDLTQLPIAIYPEGSTMPLLLPPLLHSVSGTPLPPNPPAPGAKTATVNQLANVRVGPGLGYMEMGVLSPGTVIALTGRTEGNTWVQIEYPSGVEGRGWVLLELVKFEGEFAGLPFYNLLATPIAKPGDASSASDEINTPIASDNPTDVPIAPTSTADKLYGLTAVQINVRSGPASSFSSYGLIETNERVYLLGLTLNGLWYQIEYPVVPEGIAWVSSQYIKVTMDIRSLPYFDNDGSPLPTP
jgi:uncharacterized protein YraI